jgi:hypothetical protein
MDSRSVARLEVDNMRPEARQVYLERGIMAMACLREQQEGVLMHYSELQPRWAEVEATRMNFQKMAADEVAKAEFRQKPGPWPEAGQHPPPCKNDDWTW